MHSFARKKITPVYYILQFLAKETKLVQGLRGAADTHIKQEEKQHSYLHSN